MVKRAGPAVVAYAVSGVRRGWEAVAGGVESLWDLRLRPRIDDSVTGRGEKAHPCATAPRTSNMPYYVDVWRWPGSTFN